MSKSYTKHKEYKEFKSSGNMPYTNEQFDMIKKDLIPKSKMESIGNGGHREYHYEYKEEKHPSGKYDRKDMHSVEEYSTPKSKPKSKETSAYYYERQERELPSINTSNRSYNYESANLTTPYKTPTKSNKELAHNVDELDSLLDDLQKDQKRQNKSGYTSDTMESSSFDYRKGSPAIAPSSGYSTLKKEERLESSSWASNPPPVVSKAAEMRQEMYREEKYGGYTSDTADSTTYDYKRDTFTKAPSSGYSTLKKEERFENSAWASNPPPVVTKAKEMRQEMYREEKHESRIVPSQLSPAISHPVPAPLCANCHPPANGSLSRSSTPLNKVTTTVKTYHYEVPAGSDPTIIPHQTKEQTYLSTADRVTSTTHVPASPSLGCQYCSHCNSRISHQTHQVQPLPPSTTVQNYKLVSQDRTDETVIYPKPVNEVRAPEPNGHGPYSGSSYKFSETSYSSSNTREHPGIPLPRPVTPQPGRQQPPKQIEELMADFPEARFPTQPDGMYQRKVEVRHESQKQESKLPPPAPAKNVAGPPVYYPPNHTPFAQKEGYEASAMQGGGAYASGKAMYEYESGAKTKEKHTEKKKAVPVCLPLCCAMPCVIM